MHATRSLLPSPPLIPVRISFRRHGRSQRWILFCVTAVPETSDPTDAVRGHAILHQVGRLVLHGYLDGLVQVTIGHDRSTSVVLHVVDGHVAHTEEMEPLESPRMTEDEHAS